MLAQIGDEAKLLAGGQSLIPLMKLRFANPAHLVDLNFIPETSYIKEENGALRFGALTRHAEIEKSGLAAKVPIIHDCAAGIADVQVRNRGTIGGSVAEADPSGDWATVLREAAVTIDPNPDAVCFHAQQCAEKYLKARLVLADIAFRKSHDLLYLLELIVQVEPTWRYLHDSLFELTTFAVAIRYPGLDATEDQARKSVEHCRAVRSTVRPALGLMLEKS